MRLRLLSLAPFLSTISPSSASLPVSTSLTYPLTHVSIVSTHSFGSTRDLLESHIPALNLTGYQLAAESGNYTAARAAVESLPPLNIFSLRDFGLLNTVYSMPSSAIQYDIGNPATAVRMTTRVLATAIYAPLRVLLFEDEEGETRIEFDAPVSTFGGLGGERVMGVAKELQGVLERVFGIAAGGAEWRLGE